MLSIRRELNCIRVAIPADPSPLPKTPCLQHSVSRLEAWKAPPESSWRQLGVSKTSYGQLLETSWRLTEPSWRLLESLGGVLGALGAVLEAFWEVLGRSWRQIRRVLDAPWVVLEPSWELWKPCCSHLEAKRLPK